MADQMQLYDTSAPTGAPRWTEVTAMRLIDADKLQQFPIRANRCDKEHANKHFLNGIETVLEYAEQLPTVDAEAVVRCKDCIYTRKLYGRLVCKYGTCSGCILREDFFCANGERRASDGE